WLVGPVALDRFEDGRLAPGGAVTFAATVATGFGLRARILTPAATGADLVAFEAHEVCVLPAPATLTFAHAFPDGRRQLHVADTPDRTITAADAPAAWGAPSVLLLAPLLPEDIDLPSFLDRWPQADVGLLAQGLQRRVGAGRIVEHLEAPSGALIAAARPKVTVFLSEEETEAWPEGALAALARSCRAVVLTRGHHGARIITAHETVEVPAAPAERIDPTGAGDVFATALILGRRAGDRAAERLAAAYAAAAVAVRGPGPLPPLADIESRLVASDRGSDAPGEGPSA
ncbi:MAG: PfkB family carbohydrate kinase, partial [Chloroflexi bacterium]|nr:PfkB family carbohydrate kinase [Chloroflexota bacterium]